MISIFEAAVFATMLALDAMAAGFAYGANKTKIPMASAMIITAVCAGMLTLALVLGSLLRPIMPYEAAKWLAFALLFGMGLVKLFDGITKSIIRRFTIEKQFSGSFFSLKFMLTVYADPQAADIDASQSISSAEAAMLAVSLSLDGMAVGLGAALAGLNGVALVGWTLFLTYGLLVAGCGIGRRIALHSRLNLAWVGGVVLMGLAVLQVV